MTPSSTARHSIGFFLLGIVVSIAGLCVGAALYLKYGKLPVATADPSFPMEAQIVHVPLGARIARELKQPPFQADEHGLEAGAQVYARQCASCHGTPGHDVAFAKWMFPRAPQLWKQHGKGIVGVSDDEAGETYWKVENGIRLSGMPAYQKILSETEMWQVTWLLKNADKPISPQVQTTLEKAGNDQP